MLDSGRSVRGKSLRGSISFGGDIEHIALGRIGAGLQPHHCRRFRRAAIAVGRRHREGGASCQRVGHITVGHRQHLTSDAVQIGAFAGPRVGAACSALSAAADGGQLNLADGLTKGDDRRSAGHNRQRVDLNFLNGRRLAHFAKFLAIGSITDGKPVRSAYAGHDINGGCYDIPTGRHVPCISTILIVLIGLILNRTQGHMVSFTDGDDTGHGIRSRIRRDDGSGRSGQNSNLSAGCGEMSGRAIRHAVGSGTLRSGI